MLEPGRREEVKEKYQQFIVPGLTKTVKYGHKTKNYHMCQCNIGLKPPAANSVASLIKHLKTPKHKKHEAKGQW